ncbi:hypothetical protein A6E15_17965 [Natrinema saccharevitans]|uniref:Uncharacterized protein n=1 Tax=Natrinema saccharevitans TaxID=301967 RepID=A0A1S8ARZ1_9EURY|nr:hypothetical protein [Natrinema saccharevitans]OLZ39284.1 hypothetical protein A6E15_17965 [Natrinema saccharevitans]
MAANSSIGVRDLRFGLLSLVAVALTLIAQFVWMVIIDSSGLDVYAPDLLFMHILPAFTLALIPTVAAHYLYTQKWSLITGGVVFVASAIVSTFTIQFFMLCGPGC